MKIIRLNRQPFALGLRWTAPMRRVFGNKALLALAKAENPAFDLAASRRCGARGQCQYGFAAMLGDSKNCIPALACCLKIQPTFLGLFCLRDEDDQEFWWLHLRWKGVIAIYGDQVFESEAEARDALDFSLLLTGLLHENVICDKPGQSQAFLASRLRYSGLDKWLLGRGNLTSLGRMTSHSAMRVAGLCAASLVLVISAALAWSSWQNQNAIEAARKLHAQRVQRQADISAHPERFFAPEWQSRPLATDFAAACIGPMLKTPLAANGWNLRTVTCNGKNVSVDWRHDAGADFTRPPKGASLDEKDLRLARASSRIQDARVLRPDGIGTEYTMLLHRDEALGLLAEITQSTGTKLTTPVFRPAQKKTIDKVTVHAPWRSASWEISGVPDLLLEAEPGPDGISLFAMLAEIPGLSIEQITYDDGWSIRGNIHAR